MSRITYTAHPVLDKDALNDIRLLTGGKTWHMWGRKGIEREAALAEDVPANTLPVIFGSGLGHCVAKLRMQGRPVAVVDREEDILQLTGVAKAIQNDDGLCLVNDSDPHDAYDKLLAWQADNGGLPLTPVAIPLYLRIDRDYYGGLAQALKEMPAQNFWEQTRYPKFRSITPRVLFLDSNYFLCAEIRNALDRLDVEHAVIELGDTERGSNEFIETLLRAVVDFRPDFVLTVNHFGLDREGRLANLLAELELPLASWFVDNPHLILFDYAHPGTDNTVIFTFDAGNLDEMRAKGFQQIHYLPLATDISRFRPAKVKQRHRVSFVGNSMADAVTKSLWLTGLPTRLTPGYTEVAAAFGQSGETSVAKFLENNFPQWSQVLAALPTRERRLAGESLLTWEATRQYRLRCVSATLPFSPSIVGDQGWFSMLPKDGWCHTPKLNYYTELPAFYAASEINFNCTSRQMIGAVNQRVFDVPACGGFLITDHREQMEALFDLETEAVVYHKVEDIPALIERWLGDPDGREQVAEAARKRILSKHSYEKRMTDLIETMRASFA